MAHAASSALNKWWLTASQMTQQAATLAADSAVPKVPGFKMTVVRAFLEAQHGRPSKTKKTKTLPQKLTTKTPQKKMKHRSIISRRPKFPVRRECSRTGCGATIFIDGTYYAGKWTGVSPSFAPKQSGAGPSKQCTSCTQLQTTQRRKRARAAAPSPRPPASASAAPALAPSVAAAAAHAGASSGALAATLAPAALRATAPRAVRLRTTSANKHARWCMIQFVLYETKMRGGGDKASVYRTMSLSAGPGCSERAIREAIADGRRIYKMRTTSR